MRDTDDVVCVNVHARILCYNYSYTLMNLQKTLLLTGELIKRALLL